MKKLLNMPIKPTSVYAVSSIFVLLCVVGVVAPSVANYSDFYRETIAQSGSLALLVYWLYNNRNVKNMTVTISATRLFLTALFVFASLSVFWAVHIGFFVSKYLLWLGAAAILFLTLTLQQNTKTHIVLTRALLLAATYIAVVGLIQSLFSVDIFVQAKPPAATFVNRNAAAQVIVLIFPLGLFLLLVDKNKQLAKLYPYAIVLMAAYIFHTSTKSAWLSVSLEILLMIIAIAWQKNQIKEVIKTQNIYLGFKKSPHLISSLILLILLVNISAEGWAFFGNKVTANIDNLYRSAQSYGNTVGEGGRYRIWATAIDMIKQNPFAGSGMGSFFHNLITQAERYWEYGALRAHNDVLELAVELGVIGWFLLSGAIIGLLTALYKLMTQARAEQRLFYLCITVALAGSALNMQVSFPYQTAVPMMIFALYAGCIIKASDVSNPKIKTIELSLNNRHWNSLSFFVGIILVLVIIVNFHWLGASEKITQHLSKGGWPPNLVNNSLVCHRVLVKSFYDVTLQGIGKNNKFAPAISDSFNDCVPNTWAYQNAKGMQLMKRRQYNEAINILESAKQHAPKGVYVDYSNLISAYYAINNIEGVVKTVKQFTAQPIKLLAKKPKALQQLIVTLLKLNHQEQAEKYYQVYRKYYDDAAFIAKVGRFFKQPMNDPSAVEGDRQ